jgi:hypothetical protein
MKAEERKELETNVLADRVGKIVERVKGGPSRRAVVWVLLIAVVGVGFFLWWRNRGIERGELAKGWLYLGMSQYVPDQKEAATYFQSAMSRPFDKQKSGQAAIMQIIWAKSQDYERGFHVSDDAVRVTGSLIQVGNIARELDKFQDMCKDDPSLHPETLYHLAVALEYRSVLDHVDYAKLKKAAPTIFERLGAEPREPYLDQAKGFYEKIVSKYKDSGYGIRAAERIKAIESGDVKKLNEQMVRPDGPTTINVLLGKLIAAEARTKSKLGE